MAEHNISNDKGSLLNVIASLVLKLKAARNEEFGNTTIETAIPFTGADVEVFFDNHTNIYKIALERM